KSTGPSPDAKGSLRSERGLLPRDRIPGEASRGPSRPPPTTMGGKPPSESTTHRAEKIAEGRKAHEGVLPLLGADRRGSAAVVVAGEQHGALGQSAQTLGQRVVHLARVAAGKIRAAAGSDEQRVARDQPAVDE